MSDKPTLGPTAPPPLISSTPSAGVSNNNPTFYPPPPLPHQQHQQHQSPFPYPYYNPYPSHHGLPPPPLPPSQQQQTYPTYVATGYPPGSGYPPVGYGYGYYPSSAVPTIPAPLPNPFSLPPPPVPGTSSSSTSKASSDLNKKYRERSDSRRRDPDVSSRRSSHDHHRHHHRRSSADTGSKYDYRERRSSSSSSRDYYESSRRRHSVDPDYHRRDKSSSRNRSKSPGYRKEPSVERTPSSSRGHSSSEGPRSRPCSPARNPIRRKDYIPIDKKKAFLEKRVEMNCKEIIEQEKKVWIRSAPADLYYERDREKPLMMRATSKLEKLCDKFYNTCIKNVHLARGEYPLYEPPKRKKPFKKCKSHQKCKNQCSKNDNGKSSSSDSSDTSDDDEASGGDSVKDEALEWLNHRQNQPFRLDPEIWDNQKGELNDGPSCRCSSKAKKIGIRHGIYQGEEKVENLDLLTNNSEKFYHYRITISPPTNFLIKNPTVIVHDGHSFVFEGFSLFTTEPLKDLPVCNVLRFNIRYNILYFEEKVPDNFTLRELKLFHEYFFGEILELLDWDINDRFHFMPRFVRELSEDGKEILSMNEVIKYLIDSYLPLIDEMELNNLLQMPASEWLDFTDQVKGMIVTHPGKKPAGLRVDQLDREQEGKEAEGIIKFPDIVHFGSRPAQLCYAGNSEYQKTWREFVKYRHLLANMPKPSYSDKRNLENLETRLFEMRRNTKMKRDVTVAISSQGFFRTGLMADIVQHGMLLPVLVNHLRLHASLDYFEKRINYTFKNRYLLQLAMTHPSYKENYGTNPDHARNTLSNCGIRQPEYGDKKVHFQSSRKRGINMLINIMSRFGKKQETESNVQHNERLEFLGDAVVEFITSVHLFYMFTDIEEGGLATYRAALVQNQHLAILAEVLGLEKYMLYAHGSDLCHDAEMRHAMANCFESVMGAVFLDGGIEEADRIFADALFGSDKQLHKTWTKLSHHPLQLQEPGGDRHWIKTYPLLEKLTEFEKLTGIEFNHIRLLARSFTDRSLGMSNLTLGSNQRMEFLGDTVLQIVTSDYLYRHFPEHHEGHLSLLRSSIVNNRTQSVVCDDLGMTKYATFANPRHELKTKDKADLLEAFLGALYIDKDLRYCIKFAEVCFFPRLNQFIINQEWNDPKSKLQQCCLTLRTMHGKEPDIPLYKVTESKGPTNTRVYGVVVYFRDKRLAKAEGHSIQEAEMNAAKLALEKCSDLFPHLYYQKKIVERSFIIQSKEQKQLEWQEEVRQKRAELGLDEINEKARKDREELFRKRKLKEQSREKERPIPKQLPAVQLSEPKPKRIKLEEPKQPIKTKKKKVIKIEKPKKTDEDLEEGECSDEDDQEMEIEVEEEEEEEVEVKKLPTSNALASLMEYEDVNSSDSGDLLD